MRPNNRKSWAVTLIVSLMAFVPVIPVLAQGITIDGNFDDWAGQASWVDPGGADDETAPPRADITEFRVDSGSSGLCLLKAWDDTSFTGGQETTAGITLQTADNTYYRVYTTAQGNPGSVPLSDLDINSCSDSTCGSQTDVCTGSGCSGVQVGSGTSWTDPFSGRASPDCTGTSCETQDTAVELCIPWSLIGGAPGDGQFIFLKFGSYPSGPAQAPKDNTEPNGIACRNTSGTFECYPSNPNVVTLKHLEAASSTVNTMPFAGIVLAVILLTAAIGAGLWGLHQAKVKAG